MQNFLEFANDKDIEPAGEDLAYSENLIRHQLKALLARNLFEFKSYFQVMTQIDEGFLKALEVLENESYFADIIIQ